MYKRITDSVYNALSNVGTCGYIFATMLVAANTISRYVLKHSIFGAEELSAYVVLLTAFLLFPCQEAKNKHLAVEIFSEKCKNKRLVEIVYTLRGILSIVIFSVVAYNGAKVVATAAKYGAASPTLHIPKVFVFGITDAAWIMAVVVWLLILFVNKRRPL